MSTPGLVSASWSLPIRPRVSGVLGRWMRSVGRRSRSSRLTSSMPSWAARAGGDVRVVGDQADVERGEALRDELADLAEPDDADGLAVELDAGVRAALPLPRPQTRVGRRDVAGGGQQQCDRVLGGGDDVRRRGVDDHHAAGRGGRHVDVVQTDAGPGDDLQAVGGREGLGVDLGGRADEQRRRRRRARRAERAGPCRRRGGSRRRRRAARPRTARASRRAGRQGGGGGAHGSAPGSADGVGSDGRWAPTGTCRGARVGRPGRFLTLVP